MIGQLIGCDHKELLANFMVIFSYWSHVVQFTKKTGNNIIIKISAMIGRFKNKKSHFKT